MNWNLLVTKNAKKEIDRLPERDQRKIEAAFDNMAVDPFRGDIKRIHPSGWRSRVGSYRIFLDLYMEERRIVVTAVRRRTSTTY